MRLGSLFSGAGGLDMAVENVFGAETAWHCELDDAASEVLSLRWPGVPNHRDVKTTDWDAVEPVDILCGGYPCQPFSSAGQRKGSDDERHLWPYFAEAIRRLRPGYVVLENVAGHRTMGFDSVLGDLATLGFDAEWCSLRASDVGAPHGRERLFAVAYPQHGTRHGEWSRPESGQRNQITIKNDIGVCEPDSVEAFARSQFGIYAAAVLRWEKIVGEPPQPTEYGQNWLRRLNPAFSEWMMGWPRGWVTDIPGITRNDQLRIIGNGVVPQQAIAALRWLLSIERAA